MWINLLISTTLAIFLNLPAFATKDPLGPAPRPDFKKMKSNEISYFWDGTYLQIQFQTIDQVEISRNCDDKKGCEALRVSKSQFPIKAPPHPALNNPGVTYCKTMGGLALIGFNNKSQEVDICRFPDGSLLKAWSAYFKHYPPEEIKAK